MGTALKIDNLCYRYGDRLALDNVSFACSEQESLGILGPNGSGKTTLFRILSTIAESQSGSIQVFGSDFEGNLAVVRRSIGVVFQSSSLDMKLTVRENLKHQGLFYGFHGAELDSRIDELLEKFGIAERGADYAGILSGGLRRRLELAKGLLHRPRLLLLDEPTTGLDPSSRADFWRYIDQIRTSENATVIFTTHLIDEADRADLLAILESGQVVAFASPKDLRTGICQEFVVLECDDDDRLSTEVGQDFDVTVEKVDGSIRIGTNDSGKLVADLLAKYGDSIHAIHSRKTTLEDVFFAKTGKWLN